MLSLYLFFSREKALARQPPALNWEAADVKEKILSCFSLCAPQVHVRGKARAKVFLRADSAFAGRGNL